jgi:hypothetical protein
MCRVKYILLCLAAACSLLVHSKAVTPPSPRVEATTKGGNWSSNSFHTVYVSDTLAYGFDDEGFSILNVSDLSHIQLVGKYISYEARIAGLTIISNTAYLATLETGVTMLDLSQPTNPVMLARYFMPQRVEDIQVVQSRAYVALEYGGIQVLDIQNRTNLVTLGSTQTGAFNFGLQVVGSKAYVLGDGLTILDVSQPTNIAIIGRYSLPQWSPGCIQVREPFIFLCGDHSGLHVLNASDPSNIVDIATYPNNYALSDFKIAGNFLFWASGYKGIRVLDISDSAHLVLVTEQHTGGYATGLFVAPSGVYVTQYENGVTVIPYIPTVCLSLRISGAVSPAYITELQGTETLGSGTSWNTLWTVPTNTPSHFLDLEVKKTNKFYRLRAQ